MDTGARARVRIVADVPSPHQNVFYDAVARRGEIDLDVLFCRRMIPGLAFSGEGPKLAHHTFCRELRIRGVPTNPGLVWEVLTHPRDVTFVNGYYLPALLGSGLSLGLLGRPWIFWMDSLNPLSRDGSSLRRLLARSARSWYLAHATTFLSYGKRGRAALLEAGVAPERALEVPIVVDTEGIRTAVDASDREATRLSWGVGTSDRLLLFVGQMIRRKGIDLLIEAVASLPDEVKNRLQLLLIGDGADKPAFEAAVGAAGLGQRFRFLPNLDITALPTYWAASDALILPSRFDAWGVVVDEALTAGLPVMGSDACGAMADRVKPGLNGWIFPSEDVTSLARELANFVNSSNEQLRQMASAARESMEPVSADRMAEKFARVVEETLRLGVR